MMRNLNVMMLTLIGWCCALSLHAQFFTYEGLNYRVLSETEKTAEVARNNATGPIVIPEFVVYNGNKYAVTTIGDKAFNNCNSLTAIDLKNVKTIGNYAFQECYNLTAIDFKNVTTIGDYAFKSCTRLTAIDFKNVTTIGNVAFSDCHGLTSINLKKVTTIGDYAFTSCTGLTAIDFKNVTTIGNVAFGGCSRLKHIKAPNHVPTIGNNAFYSDIDRKPNVNVYVSNDSKEAYETNAQWKQYDLCFYDICQDETLYQINSLPERTATYLATFNPIPKKMVIPESVEYEGKVFKINSVGNYAFYGCSNLTSIDFKNVTTIGNEAFAYCEGLTSIDLKNVTSIGNGAFYCCDYLIRIKVPSHAPTIGDNAFNSYPDIYVSYGSKEAYETNAQWNRYHLCFYEICQDEILFQINSLSEKTATCLGTFNSTLRNIVIPESVEYKGKVFKINHVGYEAFYGCSNLTAIDFKNVTTIGNYAFQYCKGLTTIDLKNVTTIGNQAFEGCDGLTDIDFGNVTTIGDGAFQYCKGLTSIDFKNVTTIGNQAFARCNSLTSIDFKNVTTIGNQVFLQCHGLTSIDLKNVTAIGNQAFWCCGYLKRIKMPSHAPTIGDNAFDSYPNIIYVSNDSKEAYETNAQWKEYQLCFYDICQDETLYKINSLSERTATCLASFKFTLRNMVIPESVEYKGKVFKINSVGDDAFAYCSGLTSIDLKNVTTIGNQAFEGCYGLTSIDFKNVTTIGNRAFMFCGGLTAIDFGNVTTIGREAFDSCTGLTAIDFKNVTTIGDYAFYGCSSLESLILRNVETIEAKAFRGCVNLKTIEAYPTIPPVVKAGSPFDMNVYLDAKLYVPTGSKKAYEEDPYWKNFFIVESDDVTGIEEVTGATSGTANIYDLNGKLVKANATGTEGLLPGIYIVNGKKVMVK